MNPEGKINELKKSVEELEYHLRVLRNKHGDDLYEMQHPDGTYIVTPILISLVNARATLAGISL